MKVKITKGAEDSLRQIYRYFKSISQGKVGRKIRKNVITKSLSLKEFPYKGQIEDNLTHLGKGHRYLVEGNYKIIYRLEDDVIFITDIFDTRQDPERMKP